MIMRSKKALLRLFDIRKAYNDFPKGVILRFVKLEIILFYFPFSMHNLWLAKGTLENLN